MPRGEPTLHSRAPCLSQENTFAAMFVYKEGRKTCNLPPGMICRQRDFVGDPVFPALRHRWAGAPPWEAPGSASGWGASRSTACFPPHKGKTQKVHLECHDGTISQKKWHLRLLGPKFHDGTRTGPSGKVVDALKPQSPQAQTGADLGFRRRLWVQEIQAGPALPRLSRTSK